MAARELAYRGIGGLPVTGLGDDGRAGGKRLVLQRQRGSVGIENAVALGWGLGGRGSQLGRLCQDWRADTGHEQSHGCQRKRMRVAHRGFLSSKTGRRSAVMSV